MKHLFMVLLLAMVAVFASSRSHAPPPIDQNTLAVPAIASPSYCEYLDIGNTNAVQYTATQYGDDGLVPATARLEDGDRTAQPSTRIHDDSYVRREYSNELAMMAQRGRHPLRL